MWRRPPCRRRYHVAGDYGQPAGRVSQGSAASSGWECRPRPLDRPKQRDVLTRVRNTTLAEGNTAGLHEDDREPEQRGELLDSSTKDENLTFEVARLRVEDVRRDHGGNGRVEPAARGRTWNASSERVIDVAGLANEFPETMVVPLLSSRRRAHAVMMNVDEGVG